MTDCVDEIYELQHRVAQSQHGRRGWECTVDPMVEKAVFVFGLKAWKVYAMSTMKIDSSQKVC